MMHLKCGWFATIPRLIIPYIATHFVSTVIVNVNIYMFISLIVLIKTVGGVTSLGGVSLRVIQIGSSMNKYWKTTKHLYIPCQNDFSKLLKPLGDVLYIKIINSAYIIAYV